MQNGVIDVEAGWKPYRILVAAVLMQLCLGATYSWSVYVQPIRQATGMLQGQAQLPFSVFYFVFPATMVFSGGILSRFGPRRCAVSGGVLFGGGWLLAAAGEAHFLLTVCGIGILAGLGAGLAYIVPIATCIQWFPRHKGLVTGVAVAGFGGGAALVSQAAGYLISGTGSSPFHTFGIFGALFMVMICFAGMNMERPPGLEKEDPAPLPLSHILGRRSFRILYAAMFAGLAAGFAVNANLKELYHARNLHVGIAAVSLFALANAMGRIAWGFAFDRIRSATAIQANLVSQAVLLFCGFFLLRSQGGFLAFAFLTGFNYGGVLVVYASSSARSWGARRVGQVYGWLFSANIPAALSPLMAGYAYDIFGNFHLSLSLMGILLLGTAAWVRRNREVIDERRIRSES